MTNRTFSSKSNIIDLKSLINNAKSIGFREFEKADWYSYGGAERFTDNSNPLIMRTDNVTIIIDRNGISIEGNDHWLVLSSDHFDSGEF